MAEFMFTGRVELNGVRFYVTANDMEEAIAKAKRRDYDHYDMDSAEGVDSQIDAGSGVRND